MPLQLTISCSSKCRLALPFWYRLTRVVLLCCCCCCFVLLLTALAREIVHLPPSIHLSVSTLFFKLTDLWPWSFACVSVTAMTCWDWNWKSQVKVKTRSVWPRWWIKYSFLVLQDGHVNGPPDCEYSCNAECQNATVLYLHTMYGVYSNVAASSPSEGLETSASTASSHSRVQRPPANTSSRRSTARRSSQDVVNESTMLAGEIMWWSLPFSLLIACYELLPMPAIDEPLVGWSVAPVTLCVSVCVCVSTLWKENGLSYQH